MQTIAFDFFLDGTQVTKAKLAAFTIEEAISRPYRIRVDLAPEAGQGQVAIDNLLKREAAIRLTDGTQKHWWHGIIAGAELIEGGRVPDHPDTRFRLEIVPKLWLLNLHRRTRNFLDVKVGDVVKQVLQQHGVTNSPSLTGSAVMPNVTQYEETDFDFISRLMEVDGACYWFEHAQGGHTMKIGDNANAHPAPAEFPGTEVWSKRLAITSEKVILRDYNTQHPDQVAEATKAVSPKLTAAVGAVELTDHWGTTSGERDRYAAARAGAIAARGTVLSGSGHAAGLRAGLVAKRPSGDPCLITSIRHEWRDPNFLDRDGAGELEEEAGYWNEFTGMPLPSSVAWRPERVTPVPRIDGVVPARISRSAGDQGQKGADGSYAVALTCSNPPLERNARLTQVSAGAEHGLHMPVPVNSEVLLTHVHGHPDRPIIAGALPNMNQPSLVREANKTETILKTTAGHQLVLDDKEGDEKTTLKSAKGHELVFEDKGGSEKLRLKSKGGSRLEVDDAASTTLDAQKKLAIKAMEKTEIDCKDEITITATTKITLKVGATSIVLDGSKITLKGPQIEISGDSQTKVSGGAVEVAGQGQTKISGGGMVEVSGGVIKLN